MRIRRLGDLGEGQPGVAADQGEGAHGLAPLLCRQRAEPVVWRRVGIDALRAIDVRRLREAKGDVAGIPGAADQKTRNVLIVSRAQPRTVKACDRFDAYSAGS